MEDLHNYSITRVCVCVAFSSWSPGWRGYGQEWPEWFCPCTASDAGWSPPAPSKHRPAERHREREMQLKWDEHAVISNVSITPIIHQRQTDLIPGSIVDLSCQALSLGLTGKQVLSLVQTQAENLSVQVVVLIPQLMVLLRKQKDNSSFQRRFWMKQLNQLNL